MKAKAETPIWVFGIFGASLIAISVLSSLLDGSFWQITANISLNIGISIIAVSMIDWIWRRVGGDPLMNAIMEFRATTALLSDLNNVGIKRIFVTRSLAQDRKKLLLEKMAGSKEVDMLGINLRAGWSSTPEFHELLKRNARKGKTHFKILVFEPYSIVAGQREMEEDDKEEPTKRISSTAESTLHVLEKIRSSLSTKDLDALKIKVVNKTNMYCSIIRVDETILVTKYLLHSSGSNSETLEIEGKDTTYFKIYKDEFNSMWNRAQDWPR